MHIVSDLQQSFKNTEGSACWLQFQHSGGWGLRLRDLPNVYFQSLSPLATFPNLLHCLYLSISSRHSIALNLLINACRDAGHFGWLLSGLPCQLINMRSRPKPPSKCRCCHASLQTSLCFWASYAQDHVLPLVVMSLQSGTFFSHSLIKCLS